MHRAKSLKSMAEAINLILKDRQYDAVRELVAVG